MKIKEAERINRELANIMDQYDEMLTDKASYEKMHRVEVILKWGDPRYW